jgi:hypothetical protein
MPIQDDPCWVDQARALDIVTLSSKSTYGILGMACRPSHVKSFRLQALTRGMFCHDDLLRLLSGADSSARTDSLSPTSLSACRCHDLHMHQVFLGVVLADDQP